MPLHPPRGKGPPPLFDDDEERHVKGHLSTLMHSSTHGGQVLETADYQISPAGYLGRRGKVKHIHRCLEDALFRHSPSEDNPLVASWAIAPGDGRKDGGSITVKSEDEAREAADSAREGMDRFRKRCDSALIARYEVAIGDPSR